MFVEPASMSFFHSLKWLLMVLVVCARIHVLPAIFFIANDLVHKIGAKGRALSKHTFFRASTMET